MKKFELKETKRVMLVSAKCDDCKKDCTNSHFDIMSQASFSEEPDIIKTICWTCYDKEFREKVISYKEKQMELINNERKK